MGIALWAQPFGGKQQAPRIIFYWRSSRYVEVQIKDQEFERKDIKTGISDGINVEILSGITIEDNIKVWNKTEEEKKEDEDESSEDN